MIAKLKGTVDTVGSGYLVLDVGGVGYLVHASNRTLSRIGSVTGTAASVLVETVVREDQFTLYGFCDATEKEWFQTLCTVQGVGPKAALAILSAVDPLQLPVVIASQDKAALRRADGVGDKLALRIVTELKEKAGKIALGAAATGQAQSARAPSAPLPGGAANDAVSALVNLGYDRAEAFTAVSKAARAHDGAALPELIRESLRELGT
jgi:holliday junction DNA helicase RuvA